MPTLALQDTKVILPTADSRPISINRGGMMPGWSVSFFFFVIIITTIICTLLYLTFNNMNTNFFHEILLFYFAAYKMMYDGMYYTYLYSYKYRIFTGWIFRRRKIAWASTYPPLALTDWSPQRSKKVYLPTALSWRGSPKAGPWHYTLRCGLLTNSPDASRWVPGYRWAPISHRHFRRQLLPFPYYKYVFLFVWYYMHVDMIWYHVILYIMYMYLDN